MPWYPITSTRPPCFAMLMAWYCIRGLLPISPRTSTWTETSGLSFDASADLSTALCGKPCLYCEGKHSRSVVSAVDATRTTVKSSWSMEVVYHQRFMLSAPVQIMRQDLACIEYSKWPWNLSLSLLSEIDMANEAETQSGTASFCHRPPPSPSNGPQLSGQVAAWLDGGRSDPCRI